MIKNVFCVVFLLLHFCFSTSKSQNYVQNLKSNIKGKWYYKCSVFNNSKIKLKTDKHCPVYMMSFEECDDKRELQKMPKVVINMRNGNLFENIKCNTFNANSKKIDTYYPVIRILKDSTLFAVQNFGKKYKSEYHIDQLNNDTLLIHDNKYHTFNGIEASNVKHMYYKKTMKHY